MPWHSEELHSAEQHSQNGPQQNILKNDTGRTKLCRIILSRATFCRITSVPAEWLLSEQPIQNDAHRNSIKTENHSWKQSKIRYFNSLSVILPNVILPNVILLRTILQSVSLTKYHSTKRHSTKFYSAKHHANKCHNANCYSGKFELSNVTMPTAITSSITLPKHYHAKRHPTNDIVPAVIMPSVILVMS